jgi:hypothetical protein
MEAMTEAEIARARAIMERDPFPATWAAQLERAREIVRELGDLPEPVAFDMVMRGSEQPGEVNLLADIIALRPADAPPWPRTERV